MVEIAAIGVEVASHDAQLGRIDQVRRLLPNEPQISRSTVQSELTGKYLLPALAGIEAFFLAIRAQVDPELQQALPVKLGKPYPLGQCLEITLAVQQRLRKPGALPLNGTAQEGQEAFFAFLRAGGQIRQVWGDLRGEFFQNAFQLGTLYVDVSNDTVTATKPKVEILPFGQACFIPIADFKHFARIAERYWKDQIFPNHVLPELAPYCPLIHINPMGMVFLREATQYMISMAQAGRFLPSEDVLRAPAMPREIFDQVARALHGMPFKLAVSPEEGRAQSLTLCREYRSKRWHASASQTGKIMAAVQQANRQLAAATAAKVSLQPLPTSIPNSGVQTSDKRLPGDIDYAFAARDAVVGLSAQELSKATMALPIGFVVAGDAFALVAVQGLEPGRNLFVAPDGRWLGDYIPAAYSRNPLQMQANCQLTARICEVLKKHQLLQPWPIRLRVEEREWSIDGLFRIDEAALNALPHEAAHELRQAGAMPVAYCQLLSMQHLPKLATGAIFAKHRDSEASSSLIL